MRIPLEDFTEVSLVIDDTKHSRKNGNLGTRFPPFFGQIRKNTGETDAATNADAAVAAVANAAAYASAADTNADADDYDIADADAFDADADANWRCQLKLEQNALHRFALKTSIRRTAH